jgi:hypothetical protein
MKRKVGSKIGSGSIPYSAFFIQKNKRAPSTANPPRTPMTIPAIAPPDIEDVSTALFAVPAV